MSKPIKFVNAGHVTYTAETPKNQPATRWLRMSLALPGDLTIHHTFLVEFAKSSPNGEGVEVTLPEGHKEEFHARGKNGTYGALYKWRPERYQTPLGEYLYQKAASSGLTTYRDQEAMVVKATALWSQNTERIREIWEAQAAVTSKRATKFVTDHLDCSKRDSAS